MIKIVIPGNPRTKKNSQRIVVNGKRKFILPSKAFMDYQEECGCLYLVNTVIYRLQANLTLNVCITWVLGIKWT